MDMAFVVLGAVRVSHWRPVRRSKGCSMFILLTNENE